MKYIIHKTSENDRWDAISSKYYGTPFEYPTIMSANLDVQKTDILPAGIKIKVPIPENTINKGILPWK